jgi:mitochondrial import inner membrane translocase subunit TIM23
MLIPTTNTVRFGMLGCRGLQLPSATLTRGASLTSIAKRQIAATNAPRHICTKARPSASARKATARQCRFNPRRLASTTASASASEVTKLDWNTFFALRKTRRRLQLGCSVVTMLIGGSIASVTLVNLDMEAYLSKIPLDPFITLGLVTLSSAALGWLAGPSLGSVIFYSWKRGVKAPMALKEAEFFARIKKNRVDPSVSSVGNPGE